MQREPPFWCKADIAGVVNITPEPPAETIVSTDGTEGRYLPSAHETWELSGGVMPQREWYRRGHFTPLSLFGDKGVYILQF